jgi:hypothetical protein
VCYIRGRRSEVNPVIGEAGKSEWGAGAVGRGQYRCNTPFYDSFWRIIYRKRSTRSKDLDNISFSLNALIIQRSLGGLWRRLTGSFAYCSSPLASKATIETVDTGLHALILQCVSPVAFTEVFPRAMESVDMPDPVNLGRAIPLYRDHLPGGAGAYR